MIKIRYRNTTRIEIQVDGETVGNSLDKYICWIFAIKYAAENQGSNIPVVSSAVEKIESNLDHVNPPTVTVNPLDTFIFTLGSNTTKVDSMAKIRLEIKLRDEYEIFTGIYLAYYWIRSISKKSSEEK